MADAVANTQDTVQTGSAQTVPVTDPPKAEAPKTPETPVATEQQTAAPEEVAKAKTKPKTLPTPPNNQAPTQEEGEEQVAQQKSKFAGNLHRKHIDVLHKNWGTPNVDPNLTEAMGEGGAIKKTRSGMSFLLDNGHSIMWNQNFKTSSNAPREEFIGVRKRFGSIDEQDSKAIVALAKMRGWESLKLHGSIKEKDMMWLEAQRQGVAVKNYMASPEVQAKWEEEKLLRESKQMGAGVTNGAKAEQPAPTTEGKPTPTDSKFAGGTGTPKTEDAAAKAEAQAQKAEAKSIGMRDNETFGEYIDRRIQQSSNPEIKTSFLELKSALANGRVQLSEVKVRETFLGSATGPRTVEEELKSVKNVMSKATDPAAPAQTAAAPATTTPPKQTTKAQAPKM